MSFPAAVSMKPKPLSVSRLIFPFSMSAHFLGTLIRRPLQHAPAASLAPSWERSDTDESPVGNQAQTCSGHGEEHGIEAERSARAVSKQLGDKPAANGARHADPKNYHPHPLFRPQNEIAHDVPGDDATRDPSHNSRHCRFAL